MATSCTRCIPSSLAAFNQSSGKQRYRHHLKACLTADFNFVMAVSSFFLLPWFMVLHLAAAGAATAVLSVSCKGAVCAAAASASASADAFLNAFVLAAEAAEAAAADRNATQSALLCDLCCYTFTSSCCAATHGHVIAASSLNGRLASLLEQGSSDAWSADSATSDV